LLAGLIRSIRPEIVRAGERLLAESNPMLDYPTRRICRQLLLDEAEMIAWGEQALAALTATPEARERADAWVAHLNAYGDAAGGIFDGLEVGPTASQSEAAPLPAPRSDGQPYEMDPVPRRDVRFVDPFNRAAAFDAHYRDESRPLPERVMALMAKRLREMDVPEWMAPILYKTDGKPWEYYLDLSRQLWDETRHAMLGEIGFVRRDIPFTRYPVSVAASHTLNSEFEPIEAHAVLWGIEQSLMARKTGKGYEWDVAVESGDEFAISMQDYDWADEVLHAQIGRRWLIPEHGSQAALRAYASSVIDRWAESMEATRSASSQEDWWPQLQADIGVGEDSAARGE
jgi:hypothetical protein